MGNLAGTKIRASGLDGFRRLLFSWQVDPNPILADAGLSAEMLDTPDQMIEARTYRKALNLAAERSGRRDFGLQLSQRQTFDKLGAVGYLARHAPDLAVAIERVIKFLRVFDTGSVSSLEINGKDALWSHMLVTVGDETAIQQHELAIGLACSFIQSALGESWTPAAVYFEHAAPRNASTFRAVFRCPVYFEQALNGIDFPASDLKIPLPRSDPGLFAILDQHVSMISAGISSSFVSQVRNVVQNNIETGKLRIDDVAGLMGIKRHVLQRRLKGEGTSFQVVLDDVRFELGCRYLRDTSSPIAEIASILGYSETAVFTRAFTRRSGQAPNAWRKQNGEYPTT